jgi:hypothetical protein
MQNEEMIQAAKAIHQLRDKVVLTERYEPDKTAQLKIKKLTPAYCS